MFDEPFAQGPSLLHRLDPRVRVAAAVLASVCLALLHSMEAASLGLAWAVLLAALSRPPLGALARRLGMVNLFILFLWITVPFTLASGMSPNPAPVLPPSLSDDILWHWGPLELSRRGVALTLLVTLKANSIMLVFLALVASMNAATLGAALEKLRCPPKLVFLFLFTYRYVHVIAEEWRTLRTAARLRGFVARNNGHTYRTVGNMLGMVFVRSMDRAQRVHEAMQLRGFCGVFHSVALFRAAPRDSIFSLTVVLALAAVAALEWYGR